MKIRQNGVNMGCTLIMIVATVGHFPFLVSPLIGLCVFCSASSRILSQNKTNHALDICRFAYIAKKIMENQSNTIKY